MELQLLTCKHPPLRSCSSCSPPVASALQAAALAGLPPKGNSAYNSRDKGVALIGVDGKPQARAAMHAGRAVHPCAAS